MNVREIAEKWASDRAMGGVFTSESVDCFEAGYKAALPPDGSVRDSEGNIRQDHGLRFLIGTGDVVLMGAPEERAAKDLAVGLSLELREPCWVRDLQAPAHR